MKPAFAGILAAVLALALPGAAMTQPPEHGHMLVLHVEIDPTLGDSGGVVGWHRCIDLANNQALRLNAHHEHAHTGRAGEALESAGHAVVPTSPLTPWEDCEDLEGALPILF